ncbi:MAG: TldD/PmbA family protein [Bacteroidales bacterium]|nr:TldD/PmbA family protein [Bacteroidales bacterium]
MGKNLLTPEEIAIAERCITLSLEKGAEKARVTLTKSNLELCGMLDGELDKVTHALDRCITVALFAGGRFGTFSTNRLEEKELEGFLESAIGTVRMLAPDPCRDLPSPERTAKNAAEGGELGLYDSSIEDLTFEQRLSMARRSSCWKRKESIEKGFRLLSEEGEYSDSTSDTLILDTNGLRCRQYETSFEIGYEVTLEDLSGNLISGYWWDARTFLKDLLEPLESCSETAIRRAAAHIGPKKHEGGTMNLVVESECASKLVSPLLSALGGYALQQKNSFLDGKIGEKVFGDNVTLIDFPTKGGAYGSRLFDSEGVATKEGPIIENGVVKTCFLNTYMAAKMGLSPTVEDASRPTLLPVGGCRNLEDVLEKVGEGILVTGFNGGNSSAATGNFSYGIEGFRFENGKIVHPVREMLITGNFIDLWNHLLVTADDARCAMSKIIPTLAFGEVSISG